LGHIVSTKIGPDCMKFTDRDQRDNFYENVGTQKKSAKGFK